MNCEKIHIYTAISQSGCASRKMSNKQRQHLYTYTHTSALSYHMSSYMLRIRAQQTVMGVCPGFILTSINPTWKFRYVLLTVLLNGDLVC